MKLPSPQTRRDSRGKGAASQGPASAQRVIGDVHAPSIPRVLMAFSAFAVLGVLYLTSYSNFFYDEWDWISWERPWRLDLFLLPHNEHWTTIPILVWKVLFVVFGLRSHIPYEAALLLTHVATVFILFALIRRRSGDLPAFAAALTLLVLGRGGSDIVWAFQITIVGSAAFGLLAMLLFEGNPRFRSRVPAASAALLGSVMCSMAGLAFWAAIGTELLLDPRRRRFLTAFAAPVIAFAAWFLIYDTGRIPGSPGASASLHHGGIGWNYLIDLGRFIASGLEGIVAGSFGLPTVLGVLVLPLTAILLLFHRFSRGRLAGWQLGMAAGLLTWTTLTGLGRAQNGPAAAADPHYIYVGAVFLLPLIADAARDLPWRGAWRPAFVSVFAVVLCSNALQLVDTSLGQTGLMRNEDAELQTLQIFRGATDMELYRPVDDDIMPQLVAQRYYAATDELGSPVPLATFDSLQRLPGSAVDRVLVNLFGHSLTVMADSQRPVHGLPCYQIDSGNASVMDVALADGQSLRLASSKSGDARLFLSYAAPPPLNPLLQLKLAAATAQWIHMPITNRPLVWRLRIATGAVGIVQVCGGTPELKVPTDGVRAISAAGGALDPGWSPVADSATSSGQAAKVAVATGSFKQVTFGNPLDPTPGSYDVWYRVKVTNVSLAAPELTLGLWDDTGVEWVGSSTYQANQMATGYLWVIAATHVTPKRGHYVQFTARTFATTSADWFVDEALLLPSQPELSGSAA